MADIGVDGDEFVIHLRPVEKFFAFHRDVRIPKDQVRRVREVSSAGAEVPWLRAPGTGIPGVVSLGTFWGRRTGKTFAVVYGRRPGVVVELGDGAPFDRVVLSLDDPDGLIRQLAA